MIGVQTIQYKLDAREKESWEFYYHLRNLMEFGGTQVKMYTENDLLIIEYDTTFDTKGVWGM